MDILRSKASGFPSLIFKDFSLSVYLCILPSATTIYLLCNHCGRVVALFSCDFCKNTLRDNVDVLRSTMKDINHEIISTWLNEVNNLNVIEMSLATSEVLLDLKNFDKQERLRMAATSKLNHLGHNLG